MLRSLLSAVTSIIPSQSLSQRTFLEGGFRTRGVDIGRSGMEANIMEGKVNRDQNRLNKTSKSFIWAVGFIN